MKPEEFVDSIAKIQVESVFNPYTDICSVHDSQNSAQIRRYNILAYIKSAIELGVDTL